jgi:hypothetical protein
MRTILKDRRLCSGEIDGDLDAMSRQAVKAFQRAWHLPETSLAGTDPQRLLAFIACTCELVQPE